MTVADVNDTPRALPLRVDPQPRETLPGYLRRVAAAYSCSTSAVVETISPRWAARLRVRASACVNGIGMTDRTVAAAACRLNLTDTEVRGMLLSADEDITLRFDRSAAQTFDPATGSATLHDQSTLGWIASPRADRFCTRCDRDDPGITRLEWRYPWFTICPTHLCLLRPHTPSENADVDFAKLLEVQQHLAGIVRGERSFARLSRRDGFIELVAAVEVLCRVRGGLRLKMTGLLEPWFVAELLPDAFTAVQAPIGSWPEVLEYDLTRGWHRGAFLAWALEKHGARSPFGLRADLLRYTASPGQYVGLLATDIRIPTEHLLDTSGAMVIHARSTLVPALPEELVVPHLSDFTPWLSIKGAQRAAGLAAFMIVTGDDMKTACGHLSDNTRYQVPLRRLWWNLESRGLLDAYFEAVRDATQQFLAATDIPMDARQRGA